MGLEAVAKAGKTFVVEDCTPNGIWNYVMKLKTSKQNPSDFDGAYFESEDGRFGVRISVRALDDSGFSNYNIGYTPVRGGIDGEVKPTRNNENFHGELSVILMDCLIPR